MGLLYRDLLSGEGTGQTSPPSSAAVLLAAPDVSSRRSLSAHGLRPPSWMALSRAASAHGPDRHLELHRHVQPLHTAPGRHLGWHRHVQPLCTRPPTAILDGTITCSLCTRPRPPSWIAPARAASAHGPRSPSWMAPSRAASLHTAPGRHLGWHRHVQPLCTRPPVAILGGTVTCSLSAHGPRSPSWVAPSRAASLHTAPGRHLGCSVVRLTSAHARLRRGAGGSHSTLGTLVGRAGCEASAR